MYGSRTRKEEFLGHDENCQQNMSDLEGSLVTSSRPLGRPQKRLNDRTSNSGVAAQAADGSRRTVSAADERCRRCRRSSLSCTVVPCAADIGGPFHTEPFLSLALCDWDQLWVLSIDVRLTSVFMSAQSPVRAGCQSTSWLVFLFPVFHCAK